MPRLRSLLAAIGAVVALTAAAAPGRGGRRTLDRLWVRKRQGARRPLLQGMHLVVDAAAGLTGRGVS
jgi:hypothetical protein